MKLLQIASELLMGSRGLFLADRSQKIGNDRDSAIADSLLARYKQNQRDTKCQHQQRTCGWL